MKIENKTMDEERALYGLERVETDNCRFAGEADGESALKECGAVEARNCFLDLRYPLWHDNSVVLENCEMTANCRAALWYTKNITAVKTKMHGIKALRECENAVIKECDIVSPEFGWFTDGVRMTDSTAVGEYFMMRAKNIAAHRKHEACVSSKKNQGENIGYGGGARAMGGRRLLQGLRFFARYGYGRSRARNGISLVHAACGFLFRFRRASG